MAFGVKGSSGQSISGDVMVRLGINADPTANGVTAQIVLDSGAESARMVLGPEPERISFADTLHRAGIGLTGVLTGQSVAPFASVREAAKWYGETYQGTITILEIGNECDQPGGNDAMSARAYLRYVREALAGWGSREALISTAGFSSGNPAWLNPIKAGLMSLVDLLAIHPYGQSPDGVLWGPFGNVWDIVAAYQSFGPPVRCSEWGISSSDVPDVSDRASYVSAMITALSSMGVDSEFFCSGPNMVTEFDALDSNGEPTDTWAAFTDSFS